MSKIDVKIRYVRLAGSLPTQGTPASAGFDVRSASEAVIRIAAGGRALIPTGLALELPVGVECQVRPRSGLALKSGITVLNTPGTIDADYRGEVGVILLNTSPEEFTVQPGDRVAQFVFAHVLSPKFEVVEALGSSDRGEGGYGSTGVKSPS